MISADSSPDRLKRNRGDLIACFPYLTIILFKFFRFVPYNSMPRPRLLRANGKNSKYIVTALSRRPRSPVRFVIIPQNIYLNAFIIISTKNSVKYYLILFEFYILYYYLCIDIWCVYKYWYIIFILIIKNNNYIYNNFSYFMSY